MDLRSDNCLIVSRFRVQKAWLPWEPWNGIIFCFFEVPGITYSSGKSFDIPFLLVLNTRQNKENLQNPIQSSSIIVEQEKRYISEHLIFP